MEDIEGVNYSMARIEMIYWLENFCKLENYRKIKYFNIYYPHLGEPFLEQQRHCILVDDFFETPIGIIDFSGYHYVKKNHVHGECSIQVDNLIHATNIYQIFICLRETVSLRMGNYESKERRIVDSYCEMVIKEFESTVKKKLF